MARNHNKKRNIGLMYELLLRYISSSLVEDRKKDAQVALDIVSSRFAHNTELYKEFRLFNALAKSTVSDTSVAAAILSEAKSAARRFNKDKITLEKSMLIKEVNYKLDDTEFYHRRVPNYKIYATIHTLISEWKKGDASDLGLVIQYEGKIVEWLLSQKDGVVESVEPDTAIDSLAVKILTEKFNTRYGELLNEEQRNIIKKYVFSIQSGNDGAILEHLRLIKENTLKTLDTFKSECENKILSEKIEKVYSNVSELPYDVVDDETIKRFLTVSQLKSEIKEYSEVQNG